MTERRQGGTDPQKAEKASAGCTGGNKKKTKMTVQKVESL